MVDLELADVKSSRELHDLSDIAFDSIFDGIMRHSDRTGVNVHAMKLHYGGRAACLYLWQPGTFIIR